KTSLNSFKRRMTLIRDPRVCSKLRERLERTKLAQQPERCCVRSYLFREVIACLETLRPEIQEMLVRRYLLDEPMQDVAALTGRSGHAASQALTRAKLAIRDHLDRKGLPRIEVMEEFG